VQLLDHTLSNKEHRVCFVTNVEDAFAWLLDDVYSHLLVKSREAVCVLDFIKDLELPHFKQVMH
jgi:hypothetical protein